MKEGRKDAMNKRAERGVGLRREELVLFSPFRFAVAKKKRNENKVMEDLRSVRTHAQEDLLFD